MGKTLNRQCDLLVRSYYYPEKNSSESDSNNIDRFCYSCVLNLHILNYDYLVISYTVVIVINLIVFMLLCFFHDKLSPDAS